MGDEDGRGHVHRLGMDAARHNQHLIQVFQNSNSNNKIKTVDKFTVPVSKKTIQVPEKPYCNFFSDPQEPYLFASPDPARMKEQINYRY